MLLCIKRQFWHWLVTLLEIWKKKKKKLKFNLKEKRAKITGSWLGSVVWEGQRLQWEGVTGRGADVVFK